MKLIREMQKTKDRVKGLLTLHPHLRDSDNKLIATVWKYDLLNGGMKPMEITAQAFLTLYADDVLTNAETIRRVRQKIQEECPELRGEVYGLRKNQAEEVRTEIVK